MLNQNTLDKVSKYRNRIWELDFIRGVCIILMVMDHLFYSVSNIFNASWLASGNEWAQNAVHFMRDYFQSDLRYTVRPYVLWAFFLICGISSSFSRSNIKRGIQLVVVAYILTLGTYILESNFDFSRVIIRFGVLHMLAISILVWCIIDLICKDDYRTAACCLGFGIIILLLDSNIGFFVDTYAIDNNNFAFIHRVFLASSQGSYSADYFPLIPHMGKFMIGAAIGPVIYKKRKTIFPLLDKFSWYRPINFLGRNTLIIFIFHQPVIGLLLAIISAWFITNGDFVIFG